MNRPKLELSFVSKLVGKWDKKKLETTEFCKKALWICNNLISQVNTKVSFWALLCGKTNRNEKEEGPE